MVIQPSRSANGTPSTVFIRLSLALLMITAIACSPDRVGEDTFRDSADEQYVQGSRKLDSPYEPTSMTIVRKLLDLGSVGPNDYLIDLGSGDGRIVITAAKEYGARGFGVDLNEDLVALSKKNAVTEGVEQSVDFFVRDVLETDIRDASVVTIYLLNDLNLRLRPKFLSELRPGSRIISHDFHMGEWRPDSMLHLNIKKSYQDDTVLYLWFVPAKVFGTWSWTLSLTAEQMRIDMTLPCVLNLNQSYQNIDGVLTSGAFKMRIFDAGLTGDEIRFSAFAEADQRMIRQDYEGRVEGNAIVGTVRLKGTAQETTLKWQARRVGW